jgi:HK97 gp10 family phage protein
MSGELVMDDFARRSAAAKLGWERRRAGQSGGSELSGVAGELSAAASRVGRASSEVLLGQARKMRDTGKQLAPVGRTGDTRSTIDVFAAGTDRKARLGDLDVEVGPTTWYAHFPERGTVNRGPRPFMAPAFDQHVDDVVSGLLRIAADDLLW